MRVKLAARGSGRWQSSGGFRSKFGLTVTEIMRGFEELKARGMGDCLKLLHFHLGSQITNIRIVKGALNEAARIYTELAKLGAGLQYIDVGGGLGVDYDGSQTNFESSINYTLQEYANDVVYHIQTVCDEAGVAAPDDHLRERPRRRRLPQRAGLQRARRVGLRRREGAGRGQPRLGTAAHRPVRDLQQRDARATPSRRTTTRSRRSTWRSTCSTSATCRSTSAAWPRTCSGRSAPSSSSIVQTMDDVPEDLQNLDEQLSDTYFCNFSLFQSMPDSWAIKQLFPVMPIHRLNEKPRQSRGTRRHHLRLRRQDRSLHRPPRRQEDAPAPRHRAEPYYLGVFLVGAYQEILGDLHNLFGDTHAVHVSLDEHGGAKLDALIKGDTVREVLDYVEFDAETLLGKLRTDVETAVREGRVDYEGAGQLLRFYEDGLHGYTYLEG